MFERFTERARQIVILAQTEARTLRHSQIGAEHLLLGLLREEGGVGKDVLESLGFTTDNVRAEVVRLVPKTNGPSEGQIPFTPHAKEALERSLRESLALGCNYISTEHVLLGLLSTHDQSCLSIFDSRDTNTETIRSVVMTRISLKPRNAITRHEAQGFLVQAAEQIRDGLQLVICDAQVHASMEVTISLPPQSDQKTAQAVKDVLIKNGWTVTHRAAGATIAGEIVAR